MTETTIRANLMTMTKKDLVDYVVHLQHVREIYLTAINEMTMEEEE